VLKEPDFSVYDPLPGLRPSTLVHVRQQVDPCEHTSVPPGRH